MSDSRLEKFEAVHRCVTTKLEVNSFDDIKFCNDGEKKKEKSCFKVFYMQAMASDLWMGKFTCWKRVIASWRLFKQFYHVFKIKRLKENKRCKVFVAC